MEQEPRRIPVYPFDGGNKVTPRLRDALGARDYKVMARVLDMPRSTISTWHTRGVVPYESIIRIHLATGIPIRWLIMGQGPKDGSKREVRTEVEPEVVADVKNYLLPVYRLSNGDMVEADSLSFDLGLLSRYSLTPDNVTVIDHEGELLFVDRDLTNIMSGRYLVGMDGVFSIHRLQRKPANVIDMTYGDRVYEVSPSEIHISGKVVMSISNEF